MVSLAPCLGPFGGTNPRPQKTKPLGGGFFLPYRGFLLNSLFPKGSFSTQVRSFWTLLKPTHNFLGGTFGGIFKSIHKGFSFFYPFRRFKNIFFSADVAGSPGEWFVPCGFFRGPSSPSFFLKWRGISHGRFFLSVFSFRISPSWF